MADKNSYLPAVQDLIHRYVHMVDDDKLEALPDLFVEQASYRIISRRSHEQGQVIGILQCDSRAMIRDRIASMRRANIFEPHRYRHMVSATLIEALDADGTLHVATNYYVTRIMEGGSFELFSTGVYRDTIVQQDGEWLFRERLVVCDSTRIDSLLVIPI